MMKAKQNILVVDDETKLLEVVSALLESRGFHVFSADNGASALEIFDRENIALVLLDLMMPGLSGEEVCAAIRRRSSVPIIMLTARADEDDVVEGLTLGADDYITKPFGLKELSARVESALRRARQDAKPMTSSWRGGDLTVDFENDEVCKKGAAVPLTSSEMKILSALMRHPGKVFTREELILLALGADFDGYDRAIDSHVKNIRKKLEDDPKHPVYVLTAAGRGYKFGGE